MPEVTIAAGSRLAAEAGAAIASGGGNAVDAAIAAIITSMCTEPGIVTPTAGGFIAIDGPDEPGIIIDAYAEMPGRGADPDRFGSGDRVRMGYGGGLDTVVGYGSVATPGAWAGLEEAWRRSGSVPWRELFVPAIDAVERGFPLSTPAAIYLAFAHELVFGWDPASRAVLHHPDGRHLEAGDQVSIPHLADSLRLLAAEGAATLYLGDLGAAIVAEVDAHGGLLTRQDLAEYAAVVRTPLRFRLAEGAVSTNPVPAVGGATMAAVALLAVDQGFTGWDAAGVEAIVRVQRTVLDYRRRHLTDIDRIPDGVRRLMEAAQLGDLGALVTAPSTTHTSTADSDGLACAITVSSGYGAGAMPRSTGFWLNNSLGELELHPAGYHGLVPGTRLVSNMAPTTVRRRGSVMAIGSPGADRITTAIAAVLLNHLVAGMSLAEAVSHPRIHTEVFEGRPTVAVEPGIAIEGVSELTLRQFDEPSMYFGGVAAALADADGDLHACSDPRRDGTTMTAGRRASRR